MKTIYLLILLLAGFTARAQESFRKAFSLDFYAIEMEEIRPDIAEMGKGATKIIERKQIGKATGIYILDSGAKVYLTSPSEAIEFLGRSNQKAIISSEKIVLNEGCKYRMHYIILPQRVVKEEGGKVVSSEVIEQITATEGFVKFEDNKIWVNPDLTGNYDSNEIYFYQLGNRQTAHFNFSETAVSALTLPIRYRFKRGGNPSVPEDFATNVNVNVFVGHTMLGFSRASYQYRDKVGSLTNIRKLMYGGILGASSVTLDKTNTTKATIPITGDTKITKGLLTLGVGVTVSVNKINGGIFGGFDFAVGDANITWNYNRQPWVGIAVGYSLFSFSQ